MIRDRVRGSADHDVIELYPEYPGLGFCPICRRSTGILNIGRDHWGFCKPHRTTWYIGSNLFSRWRDEPRSTWRKNAEFLSGYRVTS